MADHNITVILEPGCLTTSLECVADEGARCNTWCTEPECEEHPSEGHEDHELKGVPCSILAWWNWDTASAFEEGYTGEPTAPRSGPITITSWGEDGIEWHYDAQEATRG